MTEIYARNVMLERGKIDLETGMFDTVIASDGEASDGHILSIDGGRIPARMPMQLAHSPMPTDTVGSLTKPRKDTKTKPAMLRATAQLEMSGDGPSAEIRRDLALMIDKGHVRAMSIRWEAIGDPVQRTALPSDHPAFVDGETEKDFRKRWGLFFPRWRALETSIVAIGADKEAIIGRANGSDGMDETTHKFWIDFAEHAKERENPEDPQAFLRDVVVWCRKNGMTDTQLVDALAGIEVAPEEESEPDDEAARLAAQTIKDMESAMDDETDHIVEDFTNGDESTARDDDSPGEMIADDDDGDDISVEAREDVEPAVADTEGVEEESDDPDDSQEIDAEPAGDDGSEEGMTSERAGDVIREEIAAMKADMRSTIQEILDARTGRVTPR